MVAQSRTRLHPSTSTQYVTLGMLHKLRELPMGPLFTLIPVLRCKGEVHGNPAPHPVQVMGSREML